MFAKSSFAKSGAKAMERSSAQNHNTLDGERGAGTAGKISLEDWTLSGRGSHVEFTHNEQVPLNQGQFLGRGAMGDVFETTVQGHRIAHKRIYIRRKISDKEKKEIEILKKLSAHEHMIQLVGSYTHRQFLGLLFFPVAVCDLHVLFEDVESCNNANISHPDEAASRSKVSSDSLRRLKALDYFSTLGDAKRAAPIYHKIGCLISAVEYLHSQQIRHKDLKPSNILLSKDRLWLSDFGSATDFSMLSQSATDNERGTPRYFSPEVAAWKPNGRSADMFSLGCVLLEIVVLHGEGSLGHIRRNRSSDTSFHANLDRVDTWCMIPRSAVSFRRHNLMQDIKLLLSLDPDVRPNATELLTRFAAYDAAQLTRGGVSIFGDCCKHKLVPPRQLSIGAMQNEVAEHKSEPPANLLRELSELKERNKHLTESNAKLKRNNTTLTENNAKLKQKNEIFVKKNKRLEDELEQHRNRSVEDDIAATAPDEPKEPKQKPSFDKELIVKRVMEKLHEKLQQQQDADITAQENNDGTDGETTSSSMTLLPLSARE